MIMTRGDSNVQVKRAGVEIISGLDDGANPITGNLVAIFVKTVIALIGTLSLIRSNGIRRPGSKTSMGTRVYNSVNVGCN